MPPSDKYYISFISSGTFTLENVMMGMAEPFASWSAHSKAFNSSFLLLKNGVFIIKNVDFVGVVVAKGRTFIHVDISTNNPLRLKNCTFNSCGCIEEGYSIDVISGSVSERKSLIVSNCNFTSCVGYNGGIFRF
jgi:hypothetical protein